MCIKLVKKDYCLIYIMLFSALKRTKQRKNMLNFFEKNLHKNLLNLRDDIYYKKYVPQPSVCFIINKPKKREIFAAHFRDRIVHHLFYNYTYELFNNTFIEDSYSCRVGKGTHYGIERLYKKIRQCSCNYAKTTYVLKMDIKGYFMHINRKLLLKISENVLNKMRYKYVSKKEQNIKWNDKIDYDLVFYLNKTIILLNPTINCIFKSKESEWNDLPKSKSLFYSKEGQGLPIGNLTSQLFSNVYLNILDQYIKRELKCKYYGRYVDDFYIVSNDKNELKQLVPQIRQFLIEKLDLNLNMGKTKLINIRNGVEFLGAYIKPNRIYISNDCLRRMNKQLYEIEHYGTNKDISCQINSFLGVLSHYKSYNIKLKLFGNMDSLNEQGYFNDNYSKFIAY